MSLSFFAIVNIIIEYSIFKLIFVNYYKNIIIIHKGMVICMPELPEVEVVRRALEKNLVGKKIVDIKVKYPNIIVDDVNEFINNVCDRKICGVKRLGKFLIFDLDKGNIISHLRMEGKYFYVKKDSIDNKHIHVIFFLDDGYMLCYQDVRKFGRMWYKSDLDLYSTDPLNKVGVDLTKTTAYSKDEIYKKIIKSKCAIKTTLLDQSIISGLGNIYVDEVLFLSKINPHLPSNKITLLDLDNILKYTQECFFKSIECGGTTIRSYTSELGVIGHNQDNLYVHTKDICKICGTKIIKDKINGRGTYYCPKCQK